MSDGHGVDAVKTWKAISAGRAQREERQKLGPLSAQSDR
jgi:hypothetical protein